MTFADVMKELESVGTAQNRKIYARHGATGEMFGVSSANLARLKKAIRTDQDLASKLWASGNHDARILGAYVADPAAMKLRELESWAKDLDNYVISDALASVVIGSPHARKLAETWIRLGRKKEYPAAVGWGVVSRLAAADPDLPDSWFENHLVTIEKEIHSSLNRVRHSMNGALISIGARSPGLEKKALAAAKRIGTVEVDHGETGCKTPDVATYIAKMKARRAGKKKS